METIESFLEGEAPVVSTDEHFDAVMADLAFIRNRWTKDKHILKYKIEQQVTDFKGLSERQLMLQSRVASAERLAEQVQTELQREREAHEECRRLLPCYRDELYTMKSAHNSNLQALNRKSQQLLDAREELFAIKEQQNIKSSNSGTPTTSYENARDSESQQGSFNSSIIQKEIGPPNTSVKKSLVVKLRVGQAFSRGPSPL